MIYIHIPFCRQKCSYCNFHFSTSLRYRDEMLGAIKKEIGLRHNELADNGLETLYFGGGTPSLLAAGEISGIMDEVARYFDFKENIEITLEANPDDLSLNFLREIKSAGINRLSIGTQSFDNLDLIMMNRAHNATQAEDSVKRAQDVGITNISIDLIYGSPGSDSAGWHGNLARAVALEVPHISSYALTVEPRTALSSWVDSRKIAAPSETRQDEDFQYMSGFLRENGFEHYEISNFAMPGWHSRHNAAYWQYRPYLGIGPSAHSYDGASKRSWNVANNARYIKALNQNSLPSEAENLSPENRFNEMLMIGLRTVWGVDLSLLKGIVPESQFRNFSARMQPKLHAGLLTTDGSRLHIPEQHWFLADGIAADLFLV